METQTKKTVAPNTKAKTPKAKTTKAKTAEVKTTKAKTSKVVKSKTISSKKPVKTLSNLFEDSLKDIFWAEKALTKALPKMVKNATSPDLINALENHLEETNKQITRLEEIFKLLGKKAVGKKCDAMEGLIEEGQGIIDETEIGSVRDAGIIAASQKIEHYEIATYGTLYAFATALDENDVSRLLLLTLEEEKNADGKLTEIALSHINVDAADRNIK